MLYIGSGWSLLKCSIDARVSRLFGQYCLFERRVCWKLRRLELLRKSWFESLAGFSSVQRVTTIGVWNRDLDRTFHFYTREETYLVTMENSGLTTEKKRATEEEAADVAIGEMTINASGHKDQLKRQYGVVVRETQNSLHLVISTNRSHGTLTECSNSLLIQFSGIMRSRLERRQCLGRAWRLRHYRHCERRPSRGSIRAHRSMFLLCRCRGLHCGAGLRHSLIRWCKCNISRATLLLLANRTATSRSITTPPSPPA
jgi:hypothetical protein